jgi:hypothetical protein
VKLNELFEMFKVYADLEKRLTESLEFSLFDDMLSELQAEVSAIEDLLDKIAELTFLRTEDDYFGAFVTIRGEYHVGENYLQEYGIEDDIEKDCIKAITTYLSATFKSEIVYSSSEIYTGEKVNQEEVTVWVNDIFAYGILKSLAGQYFFLGKTRIVILVLEVSSVNALPQNMPRSEHNNCLIRVIRQRSTHGFTDNVVEIEHLPTKIKACCSHERSQLINRELAMMMLQSRIYQASNLRGHEKVLYTFIWGQRVIIDKGRNHSYPFSEAKAITQILIEQLETLAEFSDS